jgi:hypothetical protein
MLVISVEIGNLKHPASGIDARVNGGLPAEDC